MKLRSLLCRFLRNIFFRSTSRQASEQTRRNSVKNFPMFSLSRSHLYLVKIEGSQPVSPSDFGGLIDEHDGMLKGERERRREGKGEEVKESSKNEWPWHHPTSENISYCKSMSSSVLEQLMCPGKKEMDMRKLTKLVIIKKAYGAGMKTSIGKFNRLVRGAGKKRQWDENETSSCSQSQKMWFAVCSCCRCCWMGELQYHHRVWGGGHAQGYWVEKNCEHTIVSRCSAARIERLNTTDEPVRETFFILFNLISSWHHSSNSYWMILGSSRL